MIMELLLIIVLVTGAPLIWWKREADIEEMHAMQEREKSDYIRDKQKATAFVEAVLENAKRHGHDGRLGEYTTIAVLEEFVKKQKESG